MVWKAKSYRGFFCCSSFNGKQINLEILSRLAFSGRRVNLPYFWEMSQDMMMMQCTSILRGRLDSAIDDGGTS